MDVNADRIIITLACVLGFMLGWVLGGTMVLSAMSRRPLVLTVHEGRKGKADAARDDEPALADVAAD